MLIYNNVLTKITQSQDLARLYVYIDKIYKTKQLR